MADLKSATALWLADKGYGLWSKRKDPSHFQNLTTEQIDETGKNMPWYQKLGNVLTLGNLEHNKLTRLNAVARTSAGAAGDAALRKTAIANKEILNAQLVNTTANINREWANAGRYTSGQRTAAIERAEEQTTTALAQANAANAQRMYEFQTQTAEQRAWNQAQLDAGKPSKASIVGDILGIAAQTYITNPEQTKSDLGWIGKQFGLGGGGTEAPAGATSEGMSLYGETANPSGMFASETEPSLSTLAPAKQSSIVDLFPTVSKTMNAINQISPTQPTVDIDSDIMDYKGRSPEQMGMDMADNDKFIVDFNFKMYNSLGMLSDTDFSELHSAVMRPNADIPKIITDWVNSRGF